MNPFAVMIVDDDESHRYILKRQIIETKFKPNVFEKENGRDALQFFEENEENRRIHGDIFPPLIIFLDINMPLLNGFEFMDAYEKICPDVKSVVLMVTSSGLDTDVQKSKSYNQVKGLLTKGEFGVKELEATIEKCIHLRSLEA